MANEITVPLLPGRSIDEIVEFYGMPRVPQTYEQLLPNPYVALQREDVNLQFFGIPTFKPEDSYGSCPVIGQWALSGQWARSGQGRNPASCPSGARWASCRGQIPGDLPLAALGSCSADRRCRPPHGRGGPLGSRRRTTRAFGRESGRTALRTALGTALGTDGARDGRRSGRMMLRTVLRAAPFRRNGTSIPPWR